jgi:hypothetical protein
MEKLIVPSRIGLRIAQGLYLCFNGCALYKLLFSITLFVFLKVQDAKVSSLQGIEKVFSLAS